MVNFMRVLPVAIEIIFKMMHLSKMLIDIPQLLWCLYYIVFFSLFQLYFFVKACRPYSSEITAVVPVV